MIIETLLNLSEKSQGVGHTNQVVMFCLVSLKVKCHTEQIRWQYRSQNATIGVPLRGHNSLK